MTSPTTSRAAPQTSHDVIVVGGGLAGLVSAFAIAKLQLNVLHLAPVMPKDTRTSALMTPSVKIMQDLGIIDAPVQIGVPLKKIRIIDATKRLIRAPEALFDASEVDEIAFGWNFANAKLAQQLRPLVKAQKTLTQLDASAQKLAKTDEGWEIHLSNGQTATTRLVIGADGKNSFVRANADINLTQTNHRQSALVCDLTLSMPLEGESVEYHYGNGLFTLVPAGGQKANLVWVEDAKTLEQVKSLKPEEVLAILQEKSQNLFGKLKLDTPVFVFPLSSHHVDKMGTDGVVLVGESGHAFPPIGAQGLNLSLRDVSDLIKCLNDNPINHSLDWATTISARYDELRSADIRRTSTMVNTLFSSLLTDMLPAQALRTGGIWALKTIPPLRKFAFQMGMGTT